MRLLVNTLSSSTGILLCACKGRKVKYIKLHFYEQEERRLKKESQKNFFPLLAFKKIKDQRKAWLTFNQHQGFFCSCKEAFLV